MCVPFRGRSGRTMLRASSSVPRMQSGMQALRQLAEEGNEQGAMGGVEEGNEHGAGLRLCVDENGVEWENI